MTSRKFKAQVTTWADTADPAVLKTLTPAEIQQREIIRELIHTEEEYLSGLAVVMSVCVLEGLRWAFLSAAAVAQAHVVSVAGVR
jgi:hypothetical protein